MRTAIEPFDNRHLEGAARLFAARHSADRERLPHLPVEYESESAACPALAALLEQEGTQGVVAKRRGEVVGYLLGRTLLPAPTSPAASIWRARSASVSYHGHAAQPECANDTYREMYAALSEQWVSQGLFAHYNNVSSCDCATLEAFYSLGFARDMVRALRSTSPPVDATTPPGVGIRQAGPEDIEDVVRLQIDLFKYHAGPPIYAPFLPEAFSGQRDFAEQLLTSPECAVMLAFRGGRAVGLQSLKPAEPQPGTPARTVYLTEGYTEEDERGTGVGSALLAASLQWARGRGYAWCLLNFLPANILAARFWTQNGFKPLGYRMLRVVDERIAWARG